MAAVASRSRVAAGAVRQRTVDLCDFRKVLLKSWDDAGVLTLRWKPLSPMAASSRPGWGDDEVAISAFCGPNTFPISIGDREVECRSGPDVGPPVVLFCAKK